MGSPRVSCLTFNFLSLAVFPPCFLLTCVTCSQCFPQVITTSSPCLVWFSLYILAVFSSVFGASSPCCSVNLLLCFITELSSANCRLFAFCSQRDTGLLVNQKQQRLSLRYRLLVQLTAQQTILLLWHLAVSQRLTVFGTSMLASLSLNAFKCYILPWFCRWWHLMRAVVKRSDKQKGGKVEVKLSFLLEVRFIGREKCLV